MQKDSRQKRKKIITRVAAFASDVRAFERSAFRFAESLWPAPADEATENKRKRVNEKRERKKMRRGRERRLGEEHFRSRRRLDDDDDGIEH
jgi:hypothetical protein